MESFTPNGKFRLVLEEVGTDQDGDRSWQTVFEVTDTQAAITDAWLPSLSVRLGGGTDMVLDGPIGPVMPLPVAVNGEAPKRPRGRPKKATPAAAPATEEAATPPAPAEQVSEAPAPAPAAGAPIFNPFA